MNVVIATNSPGAEVFERRGRQNYEFYRPEDVLEMQRALEESGHEVTVVEADIRFATRLNRVVDAMVVRGEELPLVFNMAYGVQGECRYTVVPAVLEMAGIRYVGAGPRGHTLALDKYTSKLLLIEAGLPTPDFQLLEREDEPLKPSLKYPLIVKPRFESTSRGIEVVHDRASLEAAAVAIFETYKQQALVETFVPGIEVDCGVLGNDPGQTLPVMMIDFGHGEADKNEIFSFAIKDARTVRHICPAPIGDALTAKIEELTLAAFAVLDCRDSARIDFRVDDDGNPFILEANSMVAIHRHASYFHSVQSLGWSYAEMVQKIVESALERYA